MRAARATKKVQLRAVKAEQLEGVNTPIKLSETAESSNIYLWVHHYRQHLSLYIVYSLFPWHHCMNI